jgi:hypothetical protein
LQRECHRIAKSVRASPSANRRAAPSIARAASARGDGASPHGVDFPPADEPAQPACGSGDVSPRTLVSVAVEPAATHVTAKLGAIAAHAKPAAIAAHATATLAAAHATATLAAATTTRAAAPRAAAA